MIILLSKHRGNVKSMSVQIYLQIYLYLAVCILMIYTKIKDANPDMSDPYSCRYDANWILN